MALVADVLYAEVIDPDSLQPVPDGTQGVLVPGHLDKEAYPLLRWWTGDRVVRRQVRCADRAHARQARRRRARPGG